MLDSEESPYNTESLPLLFRCAVFKFRLKILNWIASFMLFKLKEFCWRDSDATSNSTENVEFRPFLPSFNLTQVPNRYSCPFRSDCSGYLASFSRSANVFSELTVIFDFVDFALVHI